VERPLVQIFVVVASIQVRSLKTEVEKGSACTVFGRGLVDPKAQANAGFEVLPQNPQPASGILT